MLTCIVVERLFAETEELIGAAEAEGLRPALIGGIAVRVWVGSLGRRTHDVDLVLPAATEVERLARLLERRGYHVLDDPVWRRAVRGTGPERILVDWTGPDVVDPDSLERYRLGGTRVNRPLESRTVPVVDAADLVVLKLLGSRDQDVSDLLALVGADLAGCAPAAVAARALGGGAAVRVRAAASRLRFALHTGDTVQAVGRVLGRPPAEVAVDALTAFVDGLLVGEEE